MGGTFDPIHLGHLRLAEEAREQYRLDRVYLIPNRLPVHRSHHPASAEDRYAMALLATAGDPCLEVSRVEMERETASYSIETVRHFAGLFPRASLFFILGADEAQDLHQWHEAEELARLCTFLAAPRPGEPEDLEASLPEPWRSRVHRLRMPLLPISATDLRKRVEAGRSIRYLTTDSVLQYIDKAGLYR